jgi:GDP-L-fucose synthase
MTKIFIAGHKGMVGSAIWRRLTLTGDYNLIGRTRSELNLLNQPAVNDFFKTERPDVVVDAAARVGGILANATYPYQFLMENMVIQNNLIASAFDSGVKKFVFLGSSCIYPKLAQQPLKEEYILTGPLESTNEWYAIAKIAGVKSIEALRKQYQCDYVSFMPTNLYGPYDNFDLTTSHVLPALIRKFHEAKVDNNRPVTVWGTGTPLREFLHVDDLASAVLLAINTKLEEHLYNVGVGEDQSISSIAKLVQKVVGHTGEIEWDTYKPDGTPRKLLDVTKLKQVGWQPIISLEDGIKSTYQWFLQHVEHLKEVHIKS